MSLLLIPTVIGIIQAVMSSLLTSEQWQLVSCGLTVLDQHFIPGRHLLVSLPYTQHDVIQQRALAHTSNLTYDAHMLDSMLKNIHDELKWHLRVSMTGELSFEPTFEDDRKTDYYVVITSPEPTDDEIFENTIDQFETLQGTKSWNQRGHFFVIITGNTQMPKLLALKLFDKLWNSENILNIVVLVPTYESLVYDNVTSKETSMVFDLYTWFPYRSGYCASVQEVVTLNRWILADNRYSFKEVSLFPQKIPLNLQACSLRVSAIGYGPYVLLDGMQHNNTYKYRGLEVEFLLMVSKVMNASLVYMPPPIDTNVNQRTRMLMKLHFGFIDVVFGTIPLHLSILEYADATIPYLQTAFQWFVPCPTPVPRMETILGIFTLPVWFTLILILILTTAIVWCIGRRHHESPLYYTASSSLYNVWAVSIGVSVAEMPRTSRLRVFFLIFLWYCFVINTVFQALFVTFLMEPGFRRHIATFDDLIHSGVLYTFEESTEAALNSTLYYDYMKLQSNRMNCSNHNKCLERLFMSQDITMISIPIQADYVAFQLIPNYKKGKHVCSLDEDIYKMFFVMYMQLGSPLLDRFNTIIRRTIEAGLVDNYWSMLNWETHVKSIAKSLYDGNLFDKDMYFAFSLSHLKVAFFVLTLGYILSSIMFIGELLYTKLSAHGKWD